MQCDLPAEDVEWCMRVLHVVLQRSLWSQDVIASLVRGRLRGGDCNLPDGGARGCACQTTHALLVGVARAYLDSLHGASAASWLDPEMLPPELRANGVHESGEEEDVAAAAVERSRSPPPQDGGRLHRLPVNAVETAEDVRGSGAASSHEIPGRPATATRPATASRPSGEEAGRPATAPEPPELEGGYGDEDVESVREVVVAPMPRDVAEDEDASLVQMLFMHEGEILQEAGVNRAARLHLNDFLEECARSEDVPVEWAFLLLATTVDAQLRALQAVGACLRARGVAPQNLPPNRAVKLQRGWQPCAIRAMARVVSDIGEVQLAHAVVQPYAMPLELHGGPRRSRSPPRSGRLRGEGATDGDSGERRGEDVDGALEGLRRPAATVSEDT